MHDVGAVSVHCWYSCLGLGPSVVNRLESFLKNI